MTMLQRGKSKVAAPFSEAAKEAEKISNAFASVLETDAGKLVLAHIFFRAGYNRADHVINPRDGEVVESASNFNRGRRALYAELRALVPKTHREILLQVELRAEDGWGSGVVPPAPAAPPAEEAEPK